MTPFEFSCLSTSILSLLLGFFVYLKNKKIALNKAWALVALTISLWSLSLFGVIASENQSLAMIWQYALDVSAIFIPISFLNFVLIFTEVNKISKRNYLIQFFCSFLIGCGLAIFSFSSYFKIGVFPFSEFNFWINPGKFYFLFPITFFVIITHATHLLIRHLIRSTGIKKAQTQYILIAAVLGFAGGLTNFFPQLIKSYPIGNYFVVLYIFFIGYTITRYRFLNLRIIATEVLVGATLIALFVDAILAKTLSTIILKICILIIFAYLGWSLIKSVLKEIKRREQLEKLTKQLEEANISLKKLDKAKSEFVSIASHQLRTPLTAIKGYMSMALEGVYGKFDDRFTNILKNVYGSNEELINLVNDLLNLSRIEAGKIKLELEKVDLQELIGQMINKLKISADQKGLTVIQEPMKLPLITMDRDKMRQVLLNLIDNAIKYTQQGKITISAKKKNKEVIIEIKDTGMGLSQEEMGSLFTSFRRGENGPKFHTEGSGLGLYIAKKFIDMHKGRIWAESEGKEKGSSFFISLPC
ncbi:MAG: ATP-binding protein [Candidatus Pacebacteria bacterium]|nr:ATP-binding protein [Candidatus Paceibacterota bacterium]